VLRPDVVLAIAKRIVAETSPYSRTVVAIRSAIDSLQSAHVEGAVRLANREGMWLDKLEKCAEQIPDSEDAFIDSFRARIDPERCALEGYGL
jgi:hypothetical protein